MHFQKGKISIVFLSTSLLFFQVDIREFLGWRFRIPNIYCLVDDGIPIYMVIIFYSHNQGFVGISLRSQPANKIFPGWWFQPLWKICSSNWKSSPKFGVNIKKSLSCHHLDNHKNLKFPPSPQCHPSQERRVPYVGVSKNRGTPKWMVYNGKPY